MTSDRHTLLTPWVTRLAVLHAAAWVLLGTVVTAPAVATALRFDLRIPVTQPWAALTYPLVHEGAWHLGLVVGLLLLAGPTVERRMGARGFLLFYLYGVVGVAAFGLLFNLVTPTPPLAGALGPVLGLVFARAVYAEDEDVSLDPLPFSAPARLLLAGLAILLLVAGLVVREPGMSVAHSGGLVAGWIYFRLRALGRRPPPPLPLPMRRPALTPIRLPADAPSTGVESSSAPTPDDRASHAPAEATADEVNRVLDKISALGMESLTAEERRILTQYAERKRRVE